MLLEKLRSVDYEAIRKSIEKNLVHYLAENRADFYVVGLSGGVDSSVVAALAAEAVGGEKIMALIMPDSSSTPKDDVEDALYLAEKLGLKSSVVPIDKAVEAITTSIPFFNPLDRVALGNIKARIRMTILYYVANRFNGLVLGSSDRSELLLGYFTKYGDGGADLLPIGDLYKTQVRWLAKHLGLPNRIAFKPSSPRLWPGQEAESELGFKYDDVDQILYAVFDLNVEPSRVPEITGLPLELVEKVLKRVKSTAHKRQPPPIVSLKGIAHP